MIERFRFLLPTYIRGARGGMFLYDVTNYSSIAHIDDWLSVIRKEIRAEEIFPIIVVGNRAHLVDEREVSSAEGMRIAKSRGVNGFIEASAKTGENVKEAFEALTRLILAREENFYLEKEKKMEKKPREDNYSKNYFKLKYNRSNVRSKFIRAKMDSARVLSVFTKIYSELRQILPQGKESYRYQIINLLGKIDSFWDLTNSRFIAVALVQGKDTILYTTDNWDISADVGRVISSWSSLNASFIVISGIKYTVILCTSDILVAYSLKGNDHILIAKEEDYTLILHVEPDSGSMGNLDRGPPKDPGSASEAALVDF